LVRGYSAWALGRIGGLKARSILEANLSREKSSPVIDEIKAALDGCNDS
jgi:epoxyqueuosine reductase